MRGEVKVWITYLKVFATLNVIMLHVSAFFLDKYKLELGLELKQSVFINSFTRFCVPVFFMISGAVLFGKKESTRDFFIKRSQRLLPPFLFWSFIYIIFELFKKYVLGSKLDIEIVFQFIFDSLFINGSQEHLWFVYAIISMYLVVPIFRVWIQNSNVNEILYYLLFWFLTLGFAYPFLENKNLIFSLPMFTGFLGYALLGYWLTQSKLEIFKNRFFAVLFILIGGGITLYLSMCDYLEVCLSKVKFHEPLSLHIAIFSIGVFILFMSSKFSENSKLTFFVKQIASHSYGIYLFHILVLRVFYNLGFYSWFESSVLEILLLSTLCFVCSYTIIFFLKKIKYINVIAG